MLVSFASVHRLKQLDLCCLVSAEMFPQAAHPKLAAVISSQGGATPVIDTVVRDHADDLPGDIRKPFHLFAHDAVQVEAKRHNRPELPSRYAFDCKDATFHFPPHTRLGAHVLSVGRSLFSCRETSYIPWTKRKDHRIYQPRLTGLGWPWRPNQSSNCRILPVARQTEVSAAP